MRTRSRIAILLGLLLLIAASLGGFLWWKGRLGRQALEIGPAVQEQLTNEIAKAMSAPPYGGFKLDIKASYAQGVTTLVLVFAMKGMMHSKTLVSAT